MEECTSLKKMIFNCMKNQNNKSKVDYSDKNNFIFTKVYSIFDKNNLTIYIMLNPEKVQTNEIVKEKTKLMEAIGPNKEFQLLFNAIKKTTSLSKKEISELLRNETVCIHNETITEFKIVISSEKILSRDAYFGLE